ncbi:MAG: helix-turn-helix transcriptional regulator [Burkholderiaceae bacterium]
MPTFSSPAFSPRAGQPESAHTSPTAPSELDLLRATINQVDYGLVAVDADSATVLFANGAGRAALQCDAPGARGAPPCGAGLRLVHDRVVASKPSHAAQLTSVLLRTKSGLRGLLCLGHGAQPFTVAVVPLPAVPSDPDGAAPAHSALLVFAKQQLCDESTVTLFARERGLTSAEGQVLAQVCKGLRPTQIASRHGVQISTVRTQLRSIRLKTCTDTIRDLVHQVSVLPPMARQLSGQSTP